MEYYLEPRYDRGKSFYGKAKVVETRNKNVVDKKLYSYDTEVARITYVPPYTTYEYYGKYSHTTSRHQKEFFLQEGLDETNYIILKKEGKIKL